VLQNHTAIIHYTARIIHYLQVDKINSSSEESGFSFKKQTGKYFAAPRLFVEIHSVDI